MPRRLSIALIFAASLLPAAALALTDQADVLSPAVAPDLSRYEQIGARTVDRETGVTVAAFDLDAGPYAGTPEIAARTYLAGAAADYGLEPGTGDLELVAAQETPLGSHLRFQQTVAGIPVFESDLVVTIARESGKVVAVISNVQVGADALATGAVLGPEAARAAAIARIGCTEERLGPEPPPALGLLPGAGKLLPLAYRVVIPAADPRGEWEVMVDATSGQILRVRDLTVFVDGNALCFDPDPLTTAHVAYGTAGYTDGNDANTPQLAAQTFNRTLRDISFSAGLYRLTGPYVNIVDWDAPASPPATSPTTDFLFTRDAQGFEDTEVYWGLDQSQRWIQSRGFLNIQNGPIVADPHGFNGADNSAYYPSTNRLTYGEGGVDDAEDLDVVLHEYGHAIQSGSVPGWGAGGDTRSMGEGFGDYWAGSYSAARDLYRWEWVFNWDGHNPFWGGRYLNDTRTYPASWGGDIYSNGSIWASFLMQVWFELSRGCLDQIVLNHHFLLSSTALVTQAAQALVTSDRNLNQGLNVDTIVFYGVARGFLSAAAYEIPSITHTPIANQTVPGPYTVTAVCTSTSGISAVEVRYGVGGNINQTAAMTPTGNPNEYSGQIPDQGNNVTINYFVVATNNATNKATSPRPAPCGGNHAFTVQVQTGIAAAAAAPGRFALGDIAPNPFNPSTTITYSLGARAPVRLAVYSPAGELVRVLVNGTQEAEVYEVTWDGRDYAGRELASGVYVARLEAGAFSSNRKMILLK